MARPDVTQARDVTTLPTGPLRLHAHRSQLRIAMQQFSRNRLAVISLAVLVVIVLLALLAPVLVRHDPIKLNLLEATAPPSLGHPLGTDYFGRDVLSRVLLGGRVSLSVGLMVAAIAFAVGVPIGVVAGYAGGRLDNALMRVMDALLTFPPLLLAIAIVGSLGPEIRNVMLALGIVNIPVFARLVRSSVLSVREELFVTAAHASGAQPGRIMMLHILPNVAAPLIVQVTITLAVAVIAEASLSFLGLGAQPPTPSWGRDLNEGRRYMEDAPWMMAAPTLMLMLTVLSVNFIGDGLRDALDPRSWRKLGQQR